MLYTMGLLCRKVVELIKLRHVATVICPISALFDHVRYKLQANCLSQNSFCNPDQNLTFSTPRLLVNICALCTEHITGCTQRWACVRLFSFCWSSFVNDHLVRFYQSFVLKIIVHFSLFRSFSNLDCPFSNIVRLIKQFFQFKIYRLF